MPVKLYGRSIVEGGPVGDDGGTFRAFNPSEGREFGPEFHEATPAVVARALDSAARAFQQYRAKSAEEVAGFLEAIARNVEALGDELLETARAETALPSERLKGERGRTTAQLKMFAGVVREGSWVEATIDRAEPERKPVPKPDLRRMLIPFGPVAVFGASNFPLAFSVAGGDTASALAAGNTVVVKAHPAHPGTSELVARAVVAAAEEAGMPSGVFSLVQGQSPEVSLAVVEHPRTKAVGFTGSLRAGRALFDAAARRPEPIPVYAEMGSVNPVFVLPGALRERGAEFAEGLKQSVTLGTGQFCTNPGLVVGVQGEAFGKFLDKTDELFAAAPPGTMLNAGIRRGYEEGVERLQRIVKRKAGGAAADASRTQAAACVFSTDAATFLDKRELGEEVFGPSTLVVGCQSVEELRRVAEGLEGALTATIHGTPEDLREYAWLVRVLEQKAGRLVFNGFPTGVEVCAAMQHGGPYPATTDARTTSVGTAAIKRFARPVCYQNFPQEALPPELRDANPRRLWRLVDNRWTKD
ncbi:MAG: aldehyde dehydrogenase (NADP(+)) [Acidobacteria bacterium]|nr:aldehyde dehydrogenase (NADP(+)) [Acidobacteriota bacterium]